MRFTMLLLAALLLASPAAANCNSNDPFLCLGEAIREDARERKRERGWERIKAEEREKRLREEFRRKLQRCADSLRLGVFEPGC